MAQHAPYPIKVSIYEFKLIACSNFIKLLSHQGSFIFKINYLKSITKLLYWRLIIVTWKCWHNNLGIRRRVQPRSACFRKRKLARSRPTRKSSHSSQYRNIPWKQIIQRNFNDCSGMWCDKTHPVDWCCSTNVSSICHRNSNSLMQGRMYVGKHVSLISSLSQKCAQANDLGLWSYFEYLQL